MIPIDKLSLENGLGKTNQRIIKIAAVIGAITVIAGGYSFYLNNVWKPKVSVISVDFIKGIAKVKVGHSKIVDIYGDAIFSIGGEWGIQLGKTNNLYDSIDLVKKGMVVEYLKR
jgi:small basic protein